MPVDQVRADFEIPQRDYVLPWHLEILDLPAGSDQVFPI
jgi:hypothetical protein